MRYFVSANTNCILKLFMKTPLQLMVLAALAFLTPILAAEVPPNVIVIMADDLGYDDVSYQGSGEIQTPHIDQLAKDGVSFSNAYASYCVCGPSRAGFITGRYQDRFGFGRNPAWRPQDPECGLSLEENTLAESLKTVGYRSALIGKWHLGAHDKFHPLNRGFDEFFGHLGGGHHYWQHKLSLNRQAKNEQESYHTFLMRGREREEVEGYLTDVFTAEGIDFIKRHRNNHDKPFFLFMSYNAPHAPLDAPEDLIAEFSHIEDPKRRIYAGMVKAIDNGVGRIRSELARLGLDKNTLITFLSDNGGPTKNHSSNGKLRGKKASVYEGGFRIPMVMTCKGILPENKVFHKPVLSLDVFGTIAALAKFEILPGRPLDGTNLIPHIENNSLPHESIHLRKYDGQVSVVRHGAYKLIAKRDGRELFNLNSDLSEEKNLISSQPEKAKELEKKIKSWESELLDPSFRGLDMEAWHNYDEKNFYPKSVAQHKDGASK